MDGIRDEYRPLSRDSKHDLQAQAQVISLREGSYKLLMNPTLNSEWVDAPTGDAVLVNLQQDPAETTDLKTVEAERFTAMRTRLIEKFESIRSAPHSFSAPAFRLTSVRNTKVPAMAATEIHPRLKNTVNRLKGWQQAGDFAEYAFLNSTPGTYHIELDWAGEAPPERVFQVVDSMGAPRALNQPILLRSGESTLRLVLSENLADKANLKNLLFKPIE
jgi:hypothetical protein